MMQGFQKSDYTLTIPPQFIDTLCKEIVCEPTLTSSLEKDNLVIFVCIFSFFQAG